MTCWMSIEWKMCWEKIFQLHLLSNMIICVDQRFAVKSFGCILSDLNLQLEQSQMENPAREKSAQVSKIWLSIFCYFHCWIFSLAVKVSDHWHCHAVTVPLAAEELQKPMGFKPMSTATLQFGSCSLSVNAFLTLLSFSTVLAANKLWLQSYVIHAWDHL